MKWVFIVAAIRLAIVVLIVVVGTLLPRDHVAAISARIAATPAAVWAAITDPGRLTTWRGDVKRVELLAPIPTGPSWREHTRQGAHHPGG